MYLLYTIKECGIDSTSKKGRKTTLKGEKRIHDRGSGSLNVHACSRFDTSLSLPACAGMEGRKVGGEGGRRI